MSMTVAQAREALRQAEFDQQQRVIRKRIEQEAERREIARQNAAAMRLVKERRQAERQAALEVSLRQQGKIAPIEERDMTGRRVVRWVGSPRAAFAPFLEPPKKSSLGETHRRFADQRRADRTRQAFAALAAAEGG